MLFNILTVKGRLAASEREIQMEMLKIEQMKINETSFIN